MPRRQSSEMRMAIEALASAHAAPRAPPKATEIACRQWAGQGLLDFSQCHELAVAYDLAVTCRLPVSRAVFGDVGHARQCGLGYGRVTVPIPS